MVTAIVGRPGSAPTARRMTSASAAARRWAAVRVGPPEARSARQSRSYSASTAALTTAPSSLVYTPSRTVVPLNVDDTCSRSPSPRSRCSRSGSAAEQPVPQHQRRLIDRETPGMVDEDLLVAGEHLDRLVAAMRGRREQRRLRQRHLADRQRGLGARHRPQPSSRAHQRRCRRSAQLTPIRQPRRTRRRSVVCPQATSVGRGHRPRHRRLDPAPLGVELAHVRGQRSIGQRLRVDLPHLGHVRASSRCTISIEGKCSHLTRGV